MAWRGSISRSFNSAARSSTFRASPPLLRHRSPSVAVPRLTPRRLPFANPRTMGEIGCFQSFMPLHSLASGAQLTSHLVVKLRACCELSHGKERMDDICRTFEHPKRGIDDTIVLDFMVGLLQNMVDDLAKLKVNSRET